MTIGLGADHAGCELKSTLAEHLTASGISTRDFGTTDSSISVDYPVYARGVGQAVAERKVDLGILVCGTGIGMSIAANKVPGIRAALVHDVTTARLARRHNNANILVVAGRLIAPGLAFEVVDAFLAAEYDSRHDKRLDLIADMETPVR